MKMFIEIVAVKEQNNIQFAINLDEICLIKYPGTLRRINEKSTWTGKDFCYAIDMEIIFKNGKIENITMEREEFYEFLARLKQQKGMIEYNEIFDACQATQEEIGKIKQQYPTNKSKGG